jgi:hypothetical protein
LDGTKLTYKLKVQIFLSSVQTPENLTEHKAYINIVQQLQATEEERRLHYHCLTATSYRRGEETTLSLFNSYKLQERRGDYIIIV